MSVMTTAGGLRPRVAKKSDDYVTEFQKRASADGTVPVMSHADKREKMAAILSDECSTTWARPTSCPAPRARSA
jgi:hypothetical protein